MPDVYFMWPSIGFVVFCTLLMVTGAVWHERISERRRKK